MKLKRACFILHLSMTDLLSILIFRGCKAVMNEPSLFTNVAYQPRGERYLIKSVSYYAADKEFFHSHRLLSKFSMSLIIRIALKLFLDDIMKNGYDKAEILASRDNEINNYWPYDLKIRNFIYKKMGFGNQTVYQIEFAIQRE
jgi:hypothetical protein